MLGNVTNRQNFHHHDMADVAIDDFFVLVPDAVQASTTDKMMETIESLFCNPRNQITMFRNTSPVPRDQVVVSFAEENTGEIKYSYSGHTVPVVPCTPELREVKQEIEQKMAEVCKTPVSYNMVLINRYTSEKDCVSWHADNERTIDQTQPIASFSMGAERKFVVRKTDDRSHKKSWSLRHRDLVVMHPGAQQHFQHSLPRRIKKQHGFRYNLTFRVYKPVSRK
jgi:alkylated DNA repair dioxygenase AlkB